MMHHNDDHPLRKAPPLSDEDLDRAKSRIAKLFNFQNRYDALSQPQLILENGKGSSLLERRQSTELAIHCGGKKPQGGTVMKKRTTWIVMALILGIVGLVINLRTGSVPPGVDPEVYAAEQKWGQKDIEWKRKKAEEMVGEQYKVVRLEGSRWNIYVVFESLKTKRRLCIHTEGIVTDEAIGSYQDLAVGDTVTLVLLSPTDQEKMLQSDRLAKLEIESFLFIRRMETARTTKE